MAPFLTCIFLLATVEVSSTADGCSLLIADQDQVAQVLKKSQQLRQNKSALTVLPQLQTNMGKTTPVHVDIPASSADAFGGSLLMVSDQSSVGMSVSPLVLDVPTHSPDAISAAGSAAPTTPRSR